MDEAAHGPRSRRSGTVSRGASFYPKGDRTMGDDKQPLESEQINRDKWRGGETLIPPSAAPGHTLPESERDRATDDAGGHGAQAAPSVIPPPD
jgi:hypothetical protein